MRTDELIALLGQTPPPRPPLRWLPAIGLLILAIAAVNAAVLGLRPDIAALPPSLFVKTAILACLMAVAAQSLVRVAQPLPPRPNVLPILGFAGVMAAALAWEWSSVPVAAILHNFALPNFPFCLGAVSLYGAATAAALTWLMRFQAPASPARAATVIGWTAAAIGALGYSFHCPVDSPTFITIAYGLPIAWISVIGRLVLARPLRW